MLARLLRRLLLTQVVVGGLLGWLLARQFDLGPWLAVAVAVFMPVALLKLTLFIAALRSRVPGAPLLWWRSVIAENWVAIRLVMLRTPWTVRAPEVLPAIGKPERIPVVLVHGYLCNHRIWDTLAEQLRRAGHPVLSVDLEPVFTSIDDYAPLLDQAVARLCRATGAAQVALVGHSMGGLAIRAWLRAQGTARVARVITLGTPHVGTRADLHPLTPNSLQMVYQSQWLRTLAASETEATRALMQIALSPQDEIVYPQREQVLPGVPVQIFEGLGHIELCHNPGVIAWVLGQLGLD